MLLASTCMTTKTAHNPINHGVYNNIVLPISQYNLLCRLISLFHDNIVMSSNPSLTHI